MTRYNTICWILIKNRQFTNNVFLISSTPLLPSRGHLLLLLVSVLFLLLLVAAQKKFVDVGVGPEPWIGSLVVGSPGSLPVRSGSDGGGVDTGRGLPSSWCRRLRNISRSPNNSTNLHFRMEEHIRKNSIFTQ